MDKHAGQHLVLQSPLRRFLRRISIEKVELSKQFHDVQIGEVGQIDKEQRLLSLVQLVFPNPIRHPGPVVLRRIDFDVLSGESIRQKSQGIGLDVDGLGISPPVTQSGSVVYLIGVRLVRKHGPNLTFPVTILFDLHMESPSERNTPSWLLVSSYAKPENLIHLCQASGSQEKTNRRSCCQIKIIGSQ